MANIKSSQSPLGGKQQVKLLESVIRRMEYHFDDAVLTCHVGHRTASTHFTTRSRRDSCVEWLTDFADRMRAYADFLDEEAARLTQDKKG